MPGAAACAHRGVENLPPGNAIAVVSCSKPQYSSTNQVPPLVDQSKASAAICTLWNVFFFLTCLKCVLSVCDEFVTTTITDHNKENRSQTIALADARDILKDRLLKEFA